MKDKNAGRSYEMEFEDKYRDFLTALKNRPDSDKEARWQWAREQDVFPGFLDDITRYFRPAAYEKLVKRLSKADYVIPDTGINKWEKNEIDYGLLMEAIVLAVQEYKGENKDGTPYTFFQAVGLQYRQQADKESKEKQLGMLYTAVPARRRVYLVKLVRTVNEFRDSMQNGKNLEEIIAICAKSFLFKFSKEELEYAALMVNKAHSAVSMDQLVENEDGDTAAMEIEGRNNISEYYDEEENRDFLKEFSEKFVPVWELVSAAVPLSQREPIQYFLSKNILLSLKLEYIEDDKKRKKYQEYLEPKCGQWCSRGKCPYADNSSLPGCYVRYGIRPDDVRTGDVELNDMLSVCKGLYEKVLDNKYIHFAYSEPVHNLNDMYRLSLKDFRAQDEDEKFEFTDAVLGKATDKKSPYLSKKRKYFEEEMKKLLLQVMREENMIS